MAMTRFIMRTTRDPHIFFLIVTQSPDILKIQKHWQKRLANKRRIEAFKFKRAKEKPLAATLEPTQPSAFLCFIQINQFARKSLIFRF